MYTSKYYAEIKLTVTEDLGDPYPKFGLAVRNASNTLFYYVDGSGNYSKSRVGVVERNSTNTDWAWSESQEKGVETFSFTNGEYVTLGIYRNQNVFTFYVNGVEAFSLTDVNGFTAESIDALAILSFTTGIQVKDYFISTDTSRFE